MKTTDYLAEKIEKGKCLGYLTESISTDLTKEVGGKIYCRKPDLITREHRPHDTSSIEEDRFSDKYFKLNTEIVGKFEKIADKIKDLEKLSSELDFPNIYDSNVEPGVKHIINLDEFYKDSQNRFIFNMNRQFLFDKEENYFIAFNHYPEVFNVKEGERFLELNNENKRLRGNNLGISLLGAAGLFLGVVVFSVNKIAAGCIIPSSIFLGYYGIKKSNEFLDNCFKQKEVRRLHRGKEALDKLYGAYSKK